jgi:hypothetical protein
MFVQAASPIRFCNPELRRPSDLSIPTCKMRKIDLLINLQSWNPLPQTSRCFLHSSIGHKKLGLELLQLIAFSKEAYLELIGDQWLTATLLLLLRSDLEVSIRFVNVCLEGQDV